MSSAVLRAKFGARVLHATVTSTVPKVEFFYALDPKVNPTVKPLPGFPSVRWKWLTVPAQPDATAGTCAADITLTPEDRAANKRIYVFARATSDAGVEECSPLATVALGAASP